MISRLSWGRGLERALCERETALILSIVPVSRRLPCAFAADLGLTLGALVFQAVSLDADRVDDSEAERLCDEKIWPYVAGVVYTGAIRTATTEISDQ